ncbi:capsid protein [Sewage-associated circular DNA virus-14]|nr:capsid protein [Sewage-associated circular DNA virus-14]
MSMKYLGKRKPTTWKPRSNPLTMMRAKARTSAFRMTPRAPLSTRGWRPFISTNHELKVQDLASATYQVNTTGSITLLAVPITGADYNARIGRKVTLKSCFIRGYLRIEPGAATVGVAQAQQCRFMLVLDLQPNGAVFAITDLLNTADPTSQLNLNNRDRFRVLQDQEIAFDHFNYVTTATQTSEAFGRTIQSFKKYKRLNCEMIFNAVNGGTIADIASGALYMVWIGSNAAGANTDANAVLSTRVRYSDS